MRHHFIVDRGDTDNEVTVPYIFIDINNDGLVNQINFKSLKEARFSGEQLMTIEA